MQPNYSRWTWLVVLMLASILLWMSLIGKGPSNTCCSAAEPAVGSAAIMPVEEPAAVTEAFSFSATEDVFTSSGDASQITWAGADIGGLKALLTGHITAEGDDTLVILTGDVTSEEVRQQKERHAQAFFGPDVTLDNQITVTALIEALEEPAVVTAPETAKLYFDTGVHKLPADSIVTLDIIITWLKSNADSKAIISGFHDATGDPASNIRLAKKRAESVYNALLSAGIDAESIEMRKPESAADDGDLSEARRVEISIE